jgi:hypothetical protein
MSQADNTHSTTPPEIPADAVPRAVVERAIEALIVLLDALDPDPDLESNGDDEPSGRCRMHGGPSTGAPKGNKNAWKHGYYSEDGLRLRRAVRFLLKETRNADCFR